MYSSFDFIDFQNSVSNAKWNKGEQWYEIS